MGHRGRGRQAAGRDPASILRTANLSLSEPWDEVRRLAEAQRRSGVGYLCSWPSEGQDRMEEFVEQVLPDLTAT